MKTTKLGVYLIQLLATSMIIGGGVAIAGEMVAGEHNLVGWITVIFGVLLLMVGAFGSRQHKTHENHTET